MAVLCSHFVYNFITRSAYN